MRAHQVPFRVFRRMEELLHGETSAIIEDGCRSEFMHLPWYEVMAMYTDRKTDLGIFSLVNIWRFLPGRHATEKDFQLLLKSEPDLHVAGGPFYGMRYQKKSGLELSETVKIFFGFSLYRNGVASDDPFLMFVTWLPRFVAKVVCRCRPVKLCYWQAYGNLAFSPQGYDALPKGKLKLECGLP